jgi:hypothetical protein
MSLPSSYPHTILYRFKFDELSPLDWMTGLEATTALPTIHLIPQYICLFPATIPTRQISRGTKWSASLGIYSSASFLTISFLPRNWGLGTKIGTGIQTGVLGASFAERIMVVSSQISGCIFTAVCRAPMMNLGCPSSRVLCFFLGLSVVESCQ